LWVHAVSVGEVGVAKTLATGLPSDLPLLVTTITPTGQARARALFAERAAVDYLPFDLGFAVRRFLDRHRPRALICVEGDLWPLVLRAARRRGLPIAVVNGRVSDRSFRRMRRLRRILGPILDPVHCFGVQSPEDRDRLVALGVAPERIVVTGNLKFEAAAPRPLPALAALVGSLSAGRPILVAGSTMAGEEEQVLDAWRAAGGGHGSLLVLAPRHPERWPAVAALLAVRSLRFARRSETPSGPTDILLLDSLGELAGIYGLARGAFVGGTLVPTGGHNPLEPAAAGVPVAVGPSMENFQEIAAAFEAASAWERVTDAAGLGAVFSAWLGAPETARRLGERGRGLVAARQGALERTLRLLTPLLA
jgi:3-deoxy-D-manno-octulosonic-acid transferase